MATGAHALARTALFVVARSGYCTQGLPAGPPMTLQWEAAAKTLQEPGSAAPKVVQRPLLEVRTEQKEFVPNAEHPLARVGELTLVEQKSGPPF